MNPVRAALYARLSGDAALTGLLSSPTAIYHQVAPQDAATPFVVFHRQAGDPIWQFDGAHVQSDLWTCKAVDRGASASRAEDIAARIDAVLTDAPLAVAGRDLLAVYRESDVSYPETSDGDTYRHEGAQYRVETSPS